MARTIAVSDEVYEFLSKLKTPNKSFSDVIKSLTKRAKLSDIAGSKTVSKEEWRKVMESFEKQRELDDERRESLLQ